MAGGAGERFWPLSRQSRPKQLLHLTRPDKSMLAEAVERLTPLMPVEHIFIITSRALAPLIQEAATGVPDENVVAEPCKRNTAGALLYVSAYILSRYPNLSPQDISVAIVTADHKIGEEAIFVDTVDAALRAAELEPALVICGVPPDSPETGFGYIQVEQPARADGLLKVKAFHEKPTLERAKEFIAGGDCYWNSGMFFWRLSTFFEELEQAKPAMARAGWQMVDSLYGSDPAEAEKVFEGLEDISIDYALMEHASQVLMIPARFPWRDVGLWAHLDHLHEADTSGNSTVGEPVMIDSSGCIVYNAPGARDMAVGLVGVKDLVVVVTEDAVLVVPKERAQDVRHIVAELKRRDAPQR